MDSTNKPSSSHSMTFVLAVTFGFLLNLTLSFVVIYGWANQNNSIEELGSRIATLEKVSLKHVLLYGALV